MSRIESILIANRGEIASRVIRTCKKMGIRTVAVFSDADRTAPFVKQADMAIHIGGSEPSKSYLDQDKIIDAAKRAKVGAIHPGYGFLSENAVFAEKCRKENIIFIGPNSEAIAKMGSKSEAKSIMEKIGVPVIPGYIGADQSEEKLIEEAKKIGFPLLLKATAGGGGKGMRIVRGEKELTNGIASAKGEAQHAFGNDELLIEKYIESGRHIEFQIFGDQQGNVIHLLERECTIQRRYQKILEESPSPVITEELRKEMGEIAVKAAQALNYDNAGTVEFIFDEKTGDFYFLEVNTRLQVEHPVTELITGLDLVQMQIESASGLSLTLTQEEVIGKGYAIEARLCAENAAENFIPQIGTIHQFAYPDIDGFRMEAAIESGAEISVYYDPMIAKLVVWGADRMAALSKLNYVLKHTVCQGVVTNLNFLQKLIENDQFKQGKYDTHFVEQYQNELTSSFLSPKTINEICIATALYNWHLRDKKRTQLRGLPSGWRNNFYSPQKEMYLFEDQKYVLSYRYSEDQFNLTIGDQEYTAVIAHVEEGMLTVEINGLQQHYNISNLENDQYIHNAEIGNVKLIVEDRFPEKEQEKVKGGYQAPMPSQVVKVLVKRGDQVTEGTPLLVTSSMKIENTILADEDGAVESVFVKEGQNIASGYVMLKIKSNEKE